MCKSLFLAGVTRRFPQLKFGFLEGGVGWAATLYADLIGHWERRNRRGLEATDPRNLDHRRLVELAEKYASEATVRRSAIGKGCSRPKDRSRQAASKSSTTSRRAGSIAPRP